MDGVVINRNGSGCYHPDDFVEDLTLVGCSYRTEWCPLCGAYRQERDGWDGWDEWVVPINTRRKENP